MKRVLCLALVLAPFSAFAQSEEPEMVDGHPVVRAAVTQIDMEGANVDGAVVKPSLVLSVERKPGSHESFIKLRKDFNDIADWEAEQQR